MKGFQEAVADEYDGISRSVSSRPVNASGETHANGIDREVREQVIADLDWLRDCYRTGKTMRRQ